MTFDTLRYDLDDDGLATITVHRPDTLNALSVEVLDDLEEAFRAAGDDEHVKGVVLTGAGEKAFVAGADIRQFKELNGITGQRFAARGQAVFLQIEQMSKPVVAAVNGYALGGGCELALACHLRVASENARFAQPEVSLGIIPGYGGTQRLPRLVGHGLAAELILTGEQISAERACAIGLINKVAAQDELLEAAKEMARSITANAPLAVRYALEALRASNALLEQGLRCEAALFGQACATEDAQEGATAFLERREADFKGR